MTDSPGSVIPDDPGRRPERRRQGPFDPSLLVGSTDAEILQSFVDLVRTWRGRGRGSAGDQLQVRATDVAMLVAILGTDSHEIERRLVEATGCSRSTARRGRRLLIASLGALTISLASASSIGTTTDPAGTSLPDSTRVATVDVSPLPTGQRAVGRSVEVASLTVEAAPTPPTTPPTTVAAAPADPPPVAAVPAGAQAIVIIPSIGIELPIVSGGQSVIDQGVVAHYTAPGWEPPVPAGAAGTYWLAAHQSTHGGPFRTLPQIAVGAEIRVVTSGQTFVYTVTSTAVTGLYPGDEAVYGTDPTASTILLQTCIDATLRLLVRGTLTAVL